MAQVSNDGCIITGTQISQDANGGVVRFVLDAVYDYRGWVGRATTPRILYNGQQVYEGWCRPGRARWNGHKWGNMTVAWEYWAPQPGWIDADNLVIDRRVDISRGNSRQRSVTVSCTAENYRGSWWNTITCYVDVYTSRIADVSNVNFSVTIDGVAVQNRYIHIRASFTNPEGFYHGRVSGYGDDITSSFSRDIPVTPSMFNTNVSYAFVITGNDGVQYYNQTRTVYVEPSGVGAWWKSDSGSVKEVKEVWYKDNGGNIRNVTEGWYKKNGQTIKQLTK